MRNFFKKVAFVLALAMVLTNIGPAATASAAAAPSLKFKSRVVYVGGSSVSGYPDTDEKAVWIPSQNTEGYTVDYSWTSDLITVSKSGRIRTTGNGIGAAVVTVTYTPDNGGSAMTDKFTVKVRKNATDVKLAQATVDALKIEEGLNVGEEVPLKAAKSGTTPVSYKTGNFGWDNYRGVVSDQVDYEVSDESIIKVAGNKLTAVGAGEAVLTVFTYEYFGDKAKHTQEAKYNITVIGGMLGAEQITATTVKVSFGQPLPSNVSVDNFLITNNETKADYGISSITPSSDRLSVIIETFSGMTDGAEYEVAYNKDTENEAKATFTATNGTVAKLAVNKSEIPYNFETLITVDLYDANDVKIASVKESEIANYNIEWTWTKLSGSLAGDKLMLYSRGDEAEFKVTYRAYDDKGKETNVIEETFKIRALDVAIDADLYYVIDSGTGWPCRYDWFNAATNANKRTYIYADKESEVTKYMEDYVHIYITNSAGEEISQSLFEDYGYYLESSNESILQVEAYGVHNHTQWTSGGHFEDDQGIYAAIYGLKAGTANVLVKNADGKVIKTIPVTVRAKSIFKNFELSTNTINYLSNTTLLNDGAGVVLTAVDQHGVAEKGDYRNYIDVELQSGPSIQTHPFTGIDYDGWWYDRHNELQFNGNGCDPGTYRYKITVSKDGTTRVQYISVIVREPNINAADSYKLEITGSKDTALGEWGNPDKNTEIQVMHYKGGVKYQYLPLGSSGNNTINKVEITNGSISGNKKTTVNGDLTFTADDGVATDIGFDKAGGVVNNTRVKYQISEAVTVSGSTISGSTVVSKSNKGIRSVSVTIIDDEGKEKTLTGSFNVTDSQTALTITVNKSGVSIGNDGIITIEDVIKEAIGFKLYGRPINDGAVGNRMYIKEIKTSGASTVNSIPVSRGDLVLGDAVVQQGDKISVGTVTVLYKLPNTNDYVEYIITVNRIIQVNR